MKARILLFGSLSGLLLACPSSPPTSNEDTVDPADTTTTNPSLGSSSDTTEGSLTSADTTTVTTVDPTTESSSGDSSTGVPPTCGDRVVDADEECDLGDSQLLCDADCTVPVCGDGFENFPAGEYCDPGDAGETATCNADCSFAECGDTIVNASAGESCDDGPDGSLTCNTNCTVVFCGDGVISEQADEECDDAGESVDCDLNCTDASCGDGEINATAGEVCDGSGESAACDDDCTLSFCGDANSNFAAGEICDDANDIPDDGCDACFAVCGNDCWGDSGCFTESGHCIRFTCTDGANSENACDSCFGWQPITYDNWLMEGYCLDVSAVYRATQGYSTMCGGAPQCCADPGGCGGGDNAWHFSNGNNNYYVGPCLGCAEADNCTYWNAIDNGNYTRITACTR